MKRVLLDTHILLWWLSDDPKLALAHRGLISDPENQVLVSSISIAEISIKSSLGKLAAPTQVSQAITQSGFELLSFDERHAEMLRELPWHHRDPFDRMLVVQAKCEGLTLVTVDTRLRDYSIEVY